MRSKYSRALAVLAVIVLAGCKDVGLNGNIPLAQAQFKPLKPLLANDYPPATPGHAGPVFEGTHWPEAGMPVRIPAQDLVQVDSANDQVLYALRWDRPPYDRLYTRVAQGWQPHLPVRGVQPDSGALH
ncbi:MAG: hypothetical protein P8099_08580 [Gemmatimonadota bacterium]|jgi:hypothetical protein